MLIEIAVGDAYGAGFEYAPAQFTNKYNDLSCYVKHLWHKLEPGCYTDDTQMTIAIAEAIVSGESWTAEMLAQRFVSTFKRDQRRGYSKSFYAFLNQVGDGAEFLAKIEPSSDKSGAAMRAVPIGIYPTIKQVISHCEVQASITHNTGDGIRAAVAASLMAHYFIYDLGPKSTLAQFIMDHLLGPWPIPWQGEVGSKGIMSVSAAITAVMSADSFSKILKNCIAFTGDVDTVAAIALGAASCSHEVVPDLPPHLIRSLENKAYGLTFLRELDTELQAKRLKIIVGCA